MEHLKSFLTHVAILAAVCLAFWLFIQVLVWIVPEPERDDSNPPGGRSGMMVLTDDMTGCQYLYRGGLTPRMDAAGKQVCK